MRYDATEFNKLSDIEKREVAGQVRALVELLNRKYEPDMPTPTTKQILRDELVNPSLVAHRALDAGKLVGISLMRDSKLAGGRYLSDVYVDPNYRGLGIGEELVKRSLDTARKQGAKSVSLGVFAQNTIARKLYEKLGFKPESIMMKKDL